MSERTPNSSEEDAWLSYLAKEYLRFDQGSVEHDVAAIIKQMLVQAEENYDNLNAAARTAAHEIDTYYWDRTSREHGTLFEFQKEEVGFTDFHNCLYYIIIELPRFLRYDDPKQDMLVQLLLELRRLPPRPDKEEPNYDRFVHPDEPLFSEMLDDAWGGIFASDSKESVSQRHEWEEQCKEWVNFSSFVARCTAARIDDHFPDFMKYARIDIAEGLEKEFVPGPKCDSRVMVAAQYILLAGHVIDEEFIQKPRKEGKSGDRQKWRLWAGELKELLEEELAAEVREAVIAARETLVSLHPEFFPALRATQKLGV